MSGLAFVDIETTGLDPEVHVPWEVALTLCEPGDSWVVNHRWQLLLTEQEKADADPVGLEIGRFEERYGVGLVDPYYFALDFAALTAGRHLVGNVVSFDEERLRRLLRRQGVEPKWHYHIIDIEPMIVGYLAAKGQRYDLPWKSDDLSRAIGVDPDQFNRHTAMGDVEWALAEWRAIHTDI